MDRLDAMLVLVTTVDEGSLVKAACRLGCSAATVTRAVAMLEARAGERLLHRSSRQLRLTEAGERCLPIFRLVLSELASTSTTAGDQGPVGGSLVVTAPELFGRLNVMPVIETFRARHPAVTIRVLLLNRLADLVKEGVDVAVRLAPLPDSGVAAIKLGEVRRVVCAAPEYLARAGPLRHPQDLAHHVCIGRNDAGDQELWPFVVAGRGRQRARSLQVATRLSSNSAGAALDATLHGHGVGWFLSYQVAEHFAAGRLTRVLSRYEPAATPVHLIFHPRPKPGSATRAFLDQAAPVLRARLAELERLLQ